MEVCLESYLLINIMMNALILELSTRALGRHRPKRALLAALLGGVWATMVYLPNCQVLGSLPFRLAVPALMAYIACGSSSARDWAACLAAVMCMTMLLGGGALMISLMSGGWGWGQLGWCLTAGGAAGLWLTNTHVKRCWGWEVEVRIAQGAKVCRFTALIDTGNRLREPISGACVLIVSEQALRSILPEDFDARSTTLYAHNWRAVRYVTLNERGALQCFKPDELSVRAGRMSMRHEDVWIAVYPGELPGGAQALAPLELSVATGGISAQGGECGHAGCSY